MVSKICTKENVCAIFIFGCQALAKRRCCKAATTVVQSGNKLLERGYIRGCGHKIRTNKNQKLLPIFLGGHLIELLLIHHAQMRFQVSILPCFLLNELFQAIMLDLRHH